MAENERRPRMPTRGDQPNESEGGRSRMSMPRPRFIVIVLVLLTLNYVSVALLGPGQERVIDVPYNPTFREQVEAGNVERISAQGETVEGEFKKPGKADAAKKFMDRLRSALPNLPVALCSYRFPSFHPQIPWKVFLEKCDYNMPQVYWQNSHNPGEQLTRCVREFEAMTPYRPIIPAGSAYRSGTWEPTANEIQEFLRTAQSLNLSAANFWEWSNTRRYLPEVWEAASEYPWSTEPPPEDITQQFVSALNNRDPDLMTGFYNTNAVHVNAARTIQGIPAIRTWYLSLFNQILPNGKFSLTSFTGTGSSRHFAWTATSSAGSVRNGNDTFGLVDGKVGYHYTFFTVG